MRRRTFFFFSFICQFTFLPFLAVIIDRERASLLLLVLQSDLMASFGTFGFFFFLLVRITRSSENLEGFSGCTRFQMMEKSGCVNGLLLDLADKLF